MDECLKTKYTVGSYRHKKYIILVCWKRYILTLKCSIVFKLHNMQKFIESFTVSSIRQIFLIPPNKFTKV